MGGAGAGASAARELWRLDDVESAIPRLISLASVPALSAVIVQPTGTSVRAFGVTVANSADAVTADTIFEAASLSKPVFASIVLSLVREGVFDLDRPLSEYLELPNPADARARTITARHALSHTAGWRNWRFARDHTLTADFDPGARFSYSGEGYYFLQRAVERVTGRGLLRLARERIFGPLGMTRTGFMWSPELDGNVARPHSNRGQPLDSFGVRLGKGFHAVATGTSRACGRLDR